MWELRLLGDFSLLRGDVEFRRLRAQKYGHLLAYLALHSDQAHSREHLIDLFWPEAGFEESRACLRNALSSLRRQLDCPNLFLPGPREMLHLDATQIQTDVAAFERAARTGDSQVRSLYRGPFLPSCYDDWAQDERNRLEALFESLPDSLPAGTSPTKEALFRETAPSTPGLPHWLTPFCGRRREVEDLKRAIAAGDRRLIVLLGFGGTGKTRLAAEVGRQVRDEGKIRVAFVPLTDVLDGNELSTRCAEALGVPRMPLENFQDRLDRELGAEPTLLILDNLEQLVELGAPGWIASKLLAFPNLSCLVTSRLPLGVLGAFNYSLAPLDSEDAVRLFLDRARRVLPDFPDSAVLEEICTQVDRIPLAIELCASWANVLSGKGILSTLGERLHLPPGRRPLVGDRHRSLDVLLDWSCPPSGPIRDGLIRLSVARGGWSREAAEALLGEDAGTVLLQLSERSLIQSDFVEEEFRYRMLETIRTYAQEVASPEFLEEARRQHSKYYRRRGAELAEEHASNALKAFGELELDHANIRAAFEYGLSGDSETFTETLIGLDRLRWVWWVRGYEPDFEALLEMASRRIAEPLPDFTRALVHAAAARLHMHLYEFEAMIETVQHSIDIFLASNESVRLCDAYLMAAFAHESLGHFREAEGLYRKAIATIPPEDGCAVHSRVAHLGSLFLTEGNHAAAKEIYDQLWAFWDNRDDGKGHLAVIARSIGFCEMEDGKPEAALERMRFAISTFNELGERQQEAQTWDNYESMLRNLGRTEEADEALRRFESFKATKFYS